MRKRKQREVDKEEEEGDGQKSASLSESTTSEPTEPTTHKKQVVFYTYDDRVLPLPDLQGRLEDGVTGHRKVNVPALRVELDPVSTHTDVLSLVDDRGDELNNTRPLGRYELLGYIHAHMAYKGRVPAVSMHTWLNLVHHLGQVVQSTHYKIERPGEEARAWKPVQEGDIPPVLKPLYSAVPGTNIASRVFFASVPSLALDE